MQDCDFKMFIFSLSKPIGQWYVDDGCHTEVAEVTATIRATMNLVSKCSALGWLKLLIQPPIPSWTQLFIEQHNAISLVGQTTLKSNYFLRNEATTKYFEDFVGAKAKSGILLSSLT